MNDRTVGNQEPDTEVELTAVDLVKLSVTPADDVQPAEAGTPCSGRRTLSKIALPSGLLLAAVAAGGALYTRDAANSPRQAAVETAPVVMPDWVSESAAPTVPEPAPAPVRFTNPFDNTEVFEFPPGTTREEARDAVAQILRERAAERLATDPKLRSANVRK
jgi:hypothetical protein